MILQATVLLQIVDYRALVVVVVPVLFPGNDGDRAQDRLHEREQRSETCGLF